jgi:hypothetical protein
MTEERPISMAVLRSAPLPTVNLELLKACAIVQALRTTGGNVTRAARLLGMGKATLYHLVYRTADGSVVLTKNYQRKIGILVTEHEKQVATGGIE